MKKFMLSLMVMVFTVLSAHADWEKTTSIAVGDVVVLAYDADDVAKELSEVDKIGSNFVGITADYTTTPEGICPLTIVEGATEGSFAFKIGDDQYLSWASGNTLTTSEEVAAASSWTVTFTTEGQADIYNVGTPERKLQYNASSPRFACYGNSNQKAPYLWKQVAAGGVAKPTLTTSVSFIESVEVTITAAEGATVYYTLDGTDPTTDSFVYSEPLTITETTTVKAIAVVEEVASSVAEATYTKMELGTIADAATAAAGTTCYVQGTVVAAAGQGMLVADETGFIYYYNASGIPAKVGDIVTILGAISQYKGKNQFTNAATVEVKGRAAFVHPAATVMDGAALEAWASGDQPIQYVTLSGSLTMNNKYYNVGVEGTEKAVSLVSPLQRIEAADITVTGYLIYLSNSNNIDYANMIVTNVKQTFEGEAVTVNNLNYQITTTNLIQNGSFDDGVVDWYATNYTTAADPANFTWSAEGGFDEGAYITYSAGGAGTATAPRTTAAVEAGKTYLFRAYTKGTVDSKNLQYNAIWYDNNGAEGTKIGELKWGNADTWTETLIIFTPETDGAIRFRSSWTSNTSLDGVGLYEVAYTGVSTASLEEAITAAQAIIDAREGVGTEPFAISEEAVATYAEAVAGAQSVLTKEELTLEDIHDAIAALESAYATYTATRVAPDAEKQYTLQLKEGGMYMSINDGIKLSETAYPFTFEDAGNGYALKNGEQYVAFVGTGSNNWTMNATTEPYAWAVTRLADGYYTLAKASKTTEYIGVDYTEAGSSCFANKAVSEKALWTLAEYVAPVVPPVETGTYYLWNMISDFMAAGGDWGTHAIVNAKGLDYKVTLLENGKYTIDSQVSNGGESHFLNGAYNDGEAFGWTLTKVEDDRIEGAVVCTISDGTNFLTASEGIVDLAADGTVDGAKWVFLPAEARFSPDLEAMANATAEDPYDATFLLKGADFNRNDIRNTSWEVSANTKNFTIGGPNENRDTYGCEFWNNTFEMKQTIENIPNGYYTFSITGFGTNGTTVAFAGDKETPFVSTSAGSANSMGGALYYIANGDYSTTTTEKVTVSNHKLTVGIKRTNNVAEDWTAFDNARLTYYGPIDIPTYAAALAQAVIDAQAVTGIPAGAKNALDAVVAENNKVYETAEEYDAAITAITEAIAVAEAMKPLYSEYPTIKASVQTLKAQEVYKANETVVNAFDTAIAEQDDAVEAATTVEAVQAAIDGVKNAGLDFVSSVVMTAPFDLTNVYIVNPQPVETKDGWTWAKGSPHQLTGSLGEFWNQSGYSLKQTIKNLPAGEYTLTALAFTRTDMVATLSANENSINIATVGSDVVNSLYQASGWIADNGVNNLVFTLTEPTDVEIGLTADATTGDHWMVWDNFTLKYTSNGVLDPIEPEYGEIEVETKVFGEESDEAIDVATDYFSIAKAKDVIKISVADAGEGAEVYIQDKNNNNIEGLSASVGSADSAVEFELTDAQIEAIMGAANVEARALFKAPTIREYIHIKGKNVTVNKLELVEYVAPAPPVAEGTYYMYNVAKDGYLVGANSYGTRASVAPVGGIPVQLTLSDGKYIISTAALYDKGHYLGSNGYVDNGSAFGWTIAKVEGQEGVFTIAKDAEYLASSEETTALDFVGENTDGAKWKFITKAEREALFATADAENPADATFYVHNANFSRAANTTGWTKTSNGGDFKWGAGDQSNFNAQMWNGNFTATYVANDIANGKYRMKIQGFYRDGSGDNVAANHPNVVLRSTYSLNGVEDKFMSIAEEGNNSLNTGNTYGDYVFPNSQNHASTAFSNGLYENTPVVADVTNHTLTIRIANAASVSNDWTVWDNIRLEYIGQPDLTAFVEGLAEAVATAGAVEGTVPAAAYTALNDVVIAQNKEYTTAEEYEAAIAAIIEATTAAKALQGTYSQYLDVKANVQALKTQEVYTDEADAATTLDAAITTQDTAVEAATAVEAIQAAIDAVKVAGLNFVTGVTLTGVFDLTGAYVTNANAVPATIGSNTNNIPGWTVAGGSPKSETGAVTEFWNNAAASIKQTVTGLPAGYYTLTAVALTRTDMVATLAANENTTNIATVGNPPVNNQTQANEWFDAGNGVNNLEFQLTEAGDVEISLTTDNTTGDHWMVWRSFKLTYAGLDPLAGIRALYNEAISNAQDAISDPEKDAVFGKELIDLCDAILLDEPTTREGYEAAIAAINTALGTFNGALPSYKQLEAALDYADLFGIDNTALVQEIEADPTFDAAKAVATAQAKKLEVAAFVPTKYAADPSVALGTAWEDNNIKENNGGQHWNGNTAATYTEQSEGWGQNSWSCSRTQTINLPKGDYVLKVAVRSSDQSSANINVTTPDVQVSMPFPALGGVGRGIDTDGNATYADEATYANSGNGFGWEWLFIPFSVNEAGDVTISFGGSANTRYQWISFTSYELLVDMTTTGINGINAKGEGAAAFGKKAGVFDLNGRKIADTLNSTLKSGVYVVNGNKVVIK